jgi:hypothetical protein
MQQCNSFKWFPPFHRIAQVVIHSQDASQGTGVVKVHNADMAMYLLSASTQMLLVTQLVGVGQLC